MAYASTKTVDQLRAAGFTDEQIERIINVVTGHCRACYQWQGDGMCYCDYDSWPDF